MKDFEAVIKELTDVAGPGAITTAADELERFRVDHLLPKAVAFPKNTKAVADIVRVAGSHNLAVSPHGSGTKTALGNPPLRLDLVICTRRMNHIIDVDAANLSITVESGVKFRDIQARLGTEEDRCYLPLEDLETEADEVICSDRIHSGAFLPMDPPDADRATIGGIIATNSSGPRRLLYRMPRDLILGVRMVSPTGDIVGSGGKTVKNVSGYDVSKLSVGSLGSLGVLCEMTFKLLPLPEKMETLLFSFDTFDAASAFADQVLDTSLLPAAVDVLNGRAFANVPFLLTGDFDAKSYVAVIALEGFSPAVARMRREMGEMATAGDCQSSHVLEDHAHQTFWLAVSGLARALSNKHPGVVTLNAGSPISEWGTMMETLETAFSNAGVPHALQAHAGNGACIAHLLPDGTDEPTMAKAVETINDLSRHFTENGGSLVVSKAPQALKKNLNIWGEPGSAFPVMERLKQKIDPTGMMNPGRFVGGL